MNDTTRNADLQMNDDLSDDGEATFEINWIPPRGKATTGTLVVHFEDESFTERLTIMNSGRRQHFIDSVLQKWPGLESSRQSIVQRLDEFAAGDANRQESAVESDSPDSIATRLVDGIIEAGAELFRDEDGGADARAFVSLMQDDVRETRLLRSLESRRWIAKFCHDTEGIAPPAQSLTDTVCALESRALFGGVAHPVGIRLAACNDDIWLDLADPTWRVVRISREGWQVLEAVDCPVRFIRRRGMRGLPAPKPGGSLEELRRFVNLDAESDWHLLLGFVVGLASPSGPYPILELSGEPGSAKSTTARFIRQLIDPNVAGLRAQPREERDLVIAASNGYVIVLDNLSRMPGWLSDTLCRLATGGGFATRQLYTDDDEVIFNICRSVILTGVGHVADKSDLIDRSIRITLQPIPENERRAEREITSAFEGAHPRLLGALLDATCCALRGLDSVVLEKLPRMADWAKWVTAAEPALGLPSGTILNAFDSDRERANEDAVDGSPIGPALLKFVEQENGEWTGTATQLLESLNALEVPHSREWPATPRAVGGKLRYIAANLRAIGIVVEFNLEGHSRSRIIRIRREPPMVNEGAGPSAETIDIGPQSRPADGADDADGCCASPRYWEANA